MLNYSIVYAELLKHVGFRQTTDSSTPRIHPDLLKGSLHVDAVHGARALLSGEHIYATTEGLEPGKTVASWNDTESYSADHPVTYNGLVYYSLQANTGQQPAWDSPYWESNLSRYLRLSLRDSISECISHVITENNTEKHLCSYLNFSPVFEERSRSQIIVKQLDVAGESLPTFRCVEIELAALRHLVVSINQVGVRFVEAQTIPFYLYHSSQKKHVHLADITISDQEADLFVWKDVLVGQGQDKLIISYIANSINNGGRFWIGFYENDVQGDFYGFDAYRRRVNDCEATYVCPRTFGPNSAKPNAPDFGMYYEGGSWDTETAINLRITVAFDYTYAVTQAAAMFAKAIQYDVAARILGDQVSSSRLNRSKTVSENKISEILQDRIVVNQNGFPKTEKGLISMAQDYKKQIKLNLGYLGGAFFKHNFG